jgi:serine/threonine protein kinase
MNATSRDLPGGAFDETIAYEPKPSPCLSGPEGADAMPNSAPRGQQQRYAFGSGARPLEGYTIKRAIGRGGFGEVYYATSDAGKEVALKLITRNLDVERRGVQQCMNLKSPHLITVFDLKTNEAGDTFVVMEYVAGPSLATILQSYPKGLPPQALRMWLKGLVDGVSYLHDHGIVHRDLKPANLFLEEGVVKIGDYGLSKSMTGTQEPGHSQSVGTCHYMAPEISSGKYHKAIDTYAIGIILYEMITGRVPFDGESVGEVLMKHLTAQPDLSPLPEPYKSIVRRALAKDPNHRPEPVTALLPPEDAPRQAAVRFIGDGHSAPPEAVSSAPVAPQEEVLHIRAEESVFYIGPNTLPPAPPRQQARRRFWNANPMVRRAVFTRPVTPARRPAAARPTPPPPTPEPPPLPALRIRVAELASSMLWATPLALLASVLCLPTFALFNAEVPTDPQKAAYIFLMTLLGTWGVLVPSKLWESRSVESGTRRLVYLVIGLLIAAASMVLSQWTKLGPSVPLGSGIERELISWSRTSVRPPAFDGVRMAGFFGLAFAAIGWSGVTDRCRWRRFRFLPAVKAGALATLFGIVFPPQPWGLIVMTLTAIVAQLVSPWSQAAAEYAWATRKQKNVA